MKKILLSIGTLAIVGIVAAGATGAFYKDTETSAGNVFTAGTIDLTVDSSGANYNGDAVEGSKWDPVDLSGQKFFNFADLKPADHGWRNLSLHVGDNPAWACLLLYNKKDSENTAIDPELDAGDSATSPVGELGQYTQVFAWQDNDNNGQYNPGVDNALTSLNSVTLDNLNSIAIADSTHGVPLTNASTSQIYIAWCAGTQTVNSSSGAITCDGGGMSDVAQTDGFSADMEAYATQVRHNEDFKCSDVTPPPTPLE